MIDTDTLKRLAHALTEEGFIHDEQGLGVSSGMIERKYREIERLVREHGYEGGQLFPKGMFYPNLGEVYVLYDTDVYEPDEIERIMDRRIKNDLVH